MESLNLKVSFLGIAGIVMMIIGGCGMHKVFKNQEEARQYLLDRMEEKYEESFVILEEEYKNFGIINGDGYICKLSSAEDVNRTGQARVNQRGDLLDNWAVTYFSEEAENIVKKEMKDNDVVKIDSISLIAPVTSLKWDSDTEIQEYLDESRAYVEVIGMCEEGMEDDEYAEAILEFITPAYRLDVNTEISIKIGKNYYFYEKISKAENAIPTITVEDIIEEIEKKRAYMS